MPPLAYFLTFTCYGAHLHGTIKGSVSKTQNRYGSPSLPPSQQREQYHRRQLNESPFSLGPIEQAAVLQAILKAASKRAWYLHAAHIRVTHVHIVIGANAPAERVLAYFKSYATQALKELVTVKSRKHYWTHHGSTRYLWTPQSLAAANDYVLNHQGTKLACYTNPESEPGTQ